MPEASAFELRGKAALVTGAAKRLGRAIALALAEAGARVVVHFNTSADDAERTAEAIRAKGVEAWTVQADLLDPEAVDELFGCAVERTGPLDVLVNNASIFEESLLADVSIVEMERSLQINALAPMQLARAFAAQSEGGRPGAILNLLDCTITQPDPRHVAYHAGKRLLHTMTSMMATAYAPAIRVNAVAPGLILPPAGKDTAYLESMTDTNPLRAYGGADDVTAAALYLLRARFVTGQTLYVDGGHHLRGQPYV